MAGINPESKPAIQVAGNEVTDVTRDTAQVGCTKVTRAEVEAVLKAMDRAPEIKDFEINLADAHGNGYLVFQIRNDDYGWLGVSEIPTASHPDGPGAYKWKAGFFCISKNRAEKLLKFLAENVPGYVLYKTSDQCAGPVNRGW